MKKLFIFIPLLIFASIFGQSIEWARTYHNNIFSGAWDMGYRVFETNPDEYLIAATTYWCEYSPYVEHRPFYFIKVDSVGDTIWTRMYGDDAREIEAVRIYSGNIIAFDADNEVDLVEIDSETGDSVTGEIVLDWSATRLPLMCLTSDSCLVILYHLEDPWGDSICDSIFIIKMNLDFDTIWAKSYPNDFDYGGTCIASCFDGGFIIGGNRGPAYAQRYNSDGDLLWARTYDSSYSIYCMEETDDNGSILVGDYIWKIDSIGNVIWFNWPFTEGDQYTLGINKTFDNGFVICGFSVLSPTHWDSTDALIFKLDSLGNFEWSKQVDIGGSTDRFNDVIQTSDSGYLCTGTSSIRCDTCPYSPDTFDISLVKFSKDGEVIWENKTKLPNNISISVFPNPFNSTVKINVNIPKDGNITIDVYNVSGKHIRNLLNNEISVGQHNFKWDGKNDNGIDMPAGIYFIKASCSGYNASAKVLLVK